MSIEAIVSSWQAQGQPLPVPGASTRLWRQGRGEPVVCVHGVPASGFLYRKMLPALAARGFEGITLDLPGMGFADRPTAFDYSWSGLATWLVAALDAAGIHRFHLVVHDIGGPIGFDVIARVPDRILSLTALNTLVHAASFHRPWVMEPFAHPLIGPLWVATTRTPLIIPLMRMMGVHDGPSNAELRAYGALLCRGDGGAAFLKVMRSFERTQAFEDRILAALRARTFPAQVIWGAQDPALKMRQYAPQVCAALGLARWQEVRGKHFLQEDSPDPIAAHIAALAAPGTAAPGP